MTSYNDEVHDKIVSLLRGVGFIGDYPSYNGFVFNGYEVSGLIKKTMYILLGYNPLPRDKKLLKRAVALHCKRCNVTLWEFIDGRDKLWLNVPVECYKTIVPIIDDFERIQLEHVEESKRSNSEHKQRNDQQTSELFDTQMSGKC